MQTYRAITGRAYDLTTFTSEEAAFFREVIDLYRRSAGWSEFDSAWISLGQSTVWAGINVPTKSSLYRICQDLSSRLGIQEGRVAYPDYRDQLADLIDARFKSRYEFCKHAGIDQAHLSRVLAGKKNLSTEVLSQVRKVLNIEFGFFEKDDARVQLNREWYQDDVAVRIQELQVQIHTLEEIETRARVRTPEERLSLLGRPGLLPNFLDSVRTRIADGLDFFQVIEQAKRIAVTEQAKLARQLCKEREEALKAC